MAASLNDVAIIGIEVTKEDLEEENLRFIAAIERRPGIWNRALPTYKHASLKEQLFAEVESELGWHIKSGSPGQRAKCTWSRLLGGMRRRLFTGESTDPALSKKCMDALVFYRNMMDDINTRKEARVIAQMNSLTPPSIFEDPSKLHLFTTERITVTASQSNGGRSRQEDSAGEEEGRDDRLQRNIKIESSEEAPAWDDTADDDDSAREEESANFSYGENGLLNTNEEGGEESEEEGEMLRFIASIRAREGLWKRSSTFYRMPHMKMIWFAEVENEVGLNFENGQNARNRWSRLVKAFRHYVSEIGQTSLFTGVVRPFKYYDAMTFYEDSYKSSIARRELLAEKRKSGQDAQVGGPLPGPAPFANSASPAIETSSRTEKQNFRSALLSQMLDSTLAAVGAATASASSLASAQMPLFSQTSSPETAKRRRVSVSSDMAGASATPLFFTSPSRLPSSQHQSQLPSHTELYALVDHVMAGLPLIAATEAKGEIISFLVGLKAKFDTKRSDEKMHST